METNNLLWQNTSKIEIECLRSVKNMSKNFFYILKNDGLWQAIIWEDWNLMQKMQNYPNSFPEINVLDNFNGVNRTTMKT